jgi:glycosyltransferase involved in cell wall biosynthesis
MDLDRFYFMFSFDYNSSLERKNPLGVLRAFQAAFPNLSEDVGLVIKSTGGHDYASLKAEIYRVAHQDRRILIIDATMSRSEILSLVGQSDCYVSLHRSEGFGLGMAEAMGLGTVVIGTDYSGSTDFLSSRTAFPIRYVLRQVREGEYVFGVGQKWAEPDESAAAEAMQRVFHDPSERRTRAAAAKALVELRYSRETAGAVAIRRLEQIHTIIRKVREPPI